MNTPAGFTKMMHRLSLLFVAAACSPSNEEPPTESGVAPNTSASTSSMTSAAPSSTGTQTSSSEAQPTPSTSSAQNTSAAPSVGPSIAPSSAAPVTTNQPTSTANASSTAASSTSTNDASVNEQTSAVSSATQGSSSEPIDSTETETSSGSAASGCDGADILCADFEDVAAGQVPMGAPWIAPPGHCPDTGYQLGVEASSGSNGSQALVSSNSSTSTNACALVADLGEQSDFWVRAMVKYQGTGPTNEHEITFFELGEHPDQDDPEGRVGFRTDGCNDTDGSPFGGLEFNMTKGPGGEYTGCTGVPLEGDRFYCVEIHVAQSGGTTSGDLYLDGQVQSFTNHGMPVDHVLAEGSFRYLKLGAQTYGSVNTGPLVLDDVAVGTSRIACP